MHDQEAAGLDVISDGKVYGGDSPYGTILYYYLERISGYRLSGPPIGLPIYSTLYSPTCIGEVRRESRSTWSTCGRCARPRRSRSRCPTPAWA